MRSLPFYPTIVMALVGLGGYLGCDPNSLPTHDLGGGAVSTSGMSTDSSSIPPRTTGTIIIGSFNIQRLGPSKLSDPWVMDKFANIMQHFDVIALQEITSSDQRTLPQLVEQINKGGARYSYTISPRIGRKSTGYYEQYAYVFDTSRIRSGAEFSYVVNDEADLLHREPFVGRFETIGPAVPYSFTLINIHTDPDEISTELDVLADVFVNVRQFEYPQDDVLLLGDLNADPSKFQKLGQIPGYEPLILGMATNTRQNRTIDNILTDRQANREFTGRAGVVNMEQLFHLQLADAERISDHCPIWAEFSISEDRSGFAATAAANSGALTR